MLQILERFFLHVAISMALVLAAFAALRYWTKHNKKAQFWLSNLTSHLLVTAALIVAALAPLREPFDVWSGNNTFLKSIFDQISWILGAGLAAWGIYRLKKD